MVKIDAIYCINLKRSVERKNNSLKEFEKHNIKDVIWWDAVDGKKLNLDDIPNTLVSEKAKKTMSKGEIGCALSHIGIWKDMLKKGYRKVIVFEDDFQIKKDINKELKDSDEYLPKKWGICYLGKLDIKRWNRERLNRYFEKPGMPFLTHAYIITNDGAKNTLSTLPTDEVIDKHLATHKNRINSISFRDDLVIQRNADILSLYKLNGDSTIGNHKAFDIIWKAFHDEDARYVILAVFIDYILYIIVLLIIIILIIYFIYKKLK